MELGAEAKARTFASVHPKAASSRTTRRMGFDWALANADEHRLMVSDENTEGTFVSPRTHPHPPTPHRLNSRAGHCEVVIFVCNYASSQVSVHASNLSRPSATGGLFKLVEKRLAPRNAMPKSGRTGYASL